ncbi:MAG: hypothetical protein EXS33_06810 [Pedosphaera sp.]|nr:hypothetical protein [Pedosphaera sp.]
MPRAAPRRFWPLACRLFRWFRITVLLLVLAAVIAVIWLNQVGLPDFLKQHLRAELRAQGMEVEFNRLRYRWYRGIVAEHVVFGRAGEAHGPQFSADELTLRFNEDALWRREFQLDGVILQDGRLLWPVWETNQTPRQVAVEKIHAHLQFLPQDTWELTSFTARSFGIDLTLHGAITNAYAIRNWKFGDKPPDPNALGAFWSDLVHQLDQTSLAAPAQLNGSISGDARDLKTFAASLKFSTAQYASPWGGGKNLQLAAQTRPHSNDLLRAELKLQADDPRTPWGQAKTMLLTMQVAPSMTQLSPTNATLDLQLQDAQTRWGRAGDLALTARFAPSTNDPALVQAEYFVRADELQFANFRARQARFAVQAVQVSSNLWPRSLAAQIQLAGAGTEQARAATVAINLGATIPAPAELRLGDTNVSWATRLEKIPVDLETSLTHLQVTNLAVPTALLAGRWRAPLITIETAKGILADGQWSATGRLDAITRELSLALNTDFDPLKIAPALPDEARVLLGQFTWRAPPRFEGTARIVLPAWTNRAPDWEGAVLPTLALRGKFEVGDGTFRGVPATSGRGPLLYSNFVWQLPGLHITRPEGVLVMSYTNNDLTHEYFFHIDSGIDLKALRPLVKNKAQRAAFDLVEFTGPARVAGSIIGNWEDDKTTDARLQVTVTNFSFRGQSISELDTGLTFTNNLLTFANTRIHRPEGTGTVSEVRVDFNRDKIFITNGLSTLAPAAALRALGPKVEKTMAPFQFGRPPTVRFNGVVDLDPKTTLDDMRFEIFGGPFQWRDYRLTEVTTIAHWLGDTLTLTNVQGAFHEGRVAGDAHFAFLPGGSADFSFHVGLSEVNLHSLMVDLFSKTNKLEGVLGGQLSVIRANTDQPKSWQGGGEMKLRDGLIWEFPVFGIFSPMLNKVVPGLGNSRARQATATFAITNSVLASTNLEIHASGMRMQYEGTVDFESRIHGRMEAELFRDVPLLGLLVSKVLWPVTKLLEYKVAGSLSDPKTNPLYIPKVFLMPFHPIRTLQELLPDEKKAPPEPPPKKD